MGMQFKHSELLWTLFLLLIPILIHLFQLRRFKKTPFTNVKFLQKVISESRRSSTLKKWLLLLTRMCLFAAIIIAFAQPFFANKKALQKKETVIYLDDSFSMQTKTNRLTLLEDAVQNLIGSVPENEKISLFTNTQNFKNVTIKGIQNDLLQLRPTANQLNLETIELKANTFFTRDENSIKNLILISDFQQNMAVDNKDSLTNISKHLVRLQAENFNNISIDSVFVDTQNLESTSLTALLSANYEIENTPISLFNGEELIAKTAASFTKNKKAIVRFTLPKTNAIVGKVAISDTGLSYDNQMYFNINSKEKIKVLSIGSANSNYLKKIFTSDEFQFTSNTLKQLNYGTLNTQNFIILNELESIPQALTRGLHFFTENHGNLTLIPNMEIDIASYNQLSINYGATRFLQRIKYKRNISTIHFSHPLYSKVFEKKVTNFQYPKVNGFYSVDTQYNTILSYENQEPFLMGSNQNFVFTAPLSKENSNFTGSPLIVPTFYNMAINSLKLPEIYYNLDNKVNIDLPVQLQKDRVLKVAKVGIEFIPQQKSFANKVALSFSENPKEDGVYSIKDQEVVLKKISFNFKRDESQLNYIDVTTLNASSQTDSIPSLFEQFQNDNTINALWKWFVILALLFMLIEVIIQKLL